MSRENVGRAIVVGLVSLVPLLHARAQAPSPEASLPAAVSRLRAGDPEGAARILAVVVAAEPGNGPAWRTLGQARQRLEDLDGAIEAFSRALQVEPAVPTPYFSLGVLYAAKKDPERAFEWLAKARATHRIDMTQMQGQSELAALESDPRFAALLPRPEDFQDPFVEPTTVIREWDGEAANDQFGWIARNIGDVDGDGVPDVVTSAPTKDVGGEKAGRVYVYSTKGGKALWAADGRPGDELGTGVEAAGDCNGDGIPDVIASAPGGGYARVYSGRDGRVLLTLQAEARDDLFGRHASGVGDVDGDGRADVIVGAPGNSAGGKGAGRAYVYSGRTGGVLLTLTGERAGDAFGSAVAGSTSRGDILLLVGAPGAGPGKAGRTYVYTALRAAPAFVIESDETGVSLGGMFVSVPGDVDGDGRADVYASDWGNDALGPSTGRVYVHSGRDGRRLLALTGETAGEGFGTSPSVAGDVDGDGHADLIVGAWQYAGAAVGGGRAYLYSGKDGHLIRTFTCRTPGDTFGFDAVTMGDIDGDGTSDFLITSGWSGVHGFHSGRVFIVSSGIKATAPPTQVRDSPCAVTLSAEDAAAVRAVVEAYRTSWLKGDAAGVLSTFSADAVLLPAHGAKPVVGIDAIRDYWWPAGAPPTRITRLDISVDQVGGDCRIAYAHGRDDVAWDVEENGTTRSYGHPGTYLDVFRKLADGRWRISHHMWDDSR